MNILEIDKLIEDMNRYADGGGDKKGKVSKILRDIIQKRDILNNKLTLVFITDKGIGKTSIINYLLNLIYEREKKNKNGRKKKVWQDVLETGSGATTTSETDISQSDYEYSEIIIEPYTLGEMEEIVKSFCRVVFKEVNSEFAEHAVLAPELYRAVKNMIDKKEYNNLIEEKIDIEFEIAKKYYIDNYNEFEEEILKLVNLDYRKRTRFVIDINEKENIRRVFNKINLMKIGDIPLPKKITIKLSKEVFDFDMLGNISRIIDTRGLESGVVATDRKDVKELFKNEKDKIIVLVDKFNSPTQSLMRLVDTYVQDDDLETMNRLSYLVNYRDGEPENVVSVSGKVESEVEGISVKKKDIIKQFKSNNINIKEENIIFTNPKRFLDSDGKVKIDEDDIDDYGNREEAVKHKNAIRGEGKFELCNNIFIIVDRYTKWLKESIEEKEYVMIKNKEIEELELDIDDIIKKIEKYDLLGININRNDINNIFNEYITNSHHSTVMALNNRYGLYNNQDIFLVGSSEIEKLLRGAFKDIINYSIELLLGQTNENDRGIIEFFIQDIKKYYRDFIDEVNNYIYLELKNDIYTENDIEFWKKTIERWGKGSGYLKDIAEYYNNNMEEKKFYEYVKNKSMILVEVFKKGLIAIIKENTQI